jgi:hypothetical protein
MNRQLEQTIEQIKEIAKKASIVGIAEEINQQVSLIKDRLLFKLGAILAGLKSQKPTKQSMEGLADLLIDIQNFVKKVEFLLREMSNQLLVYKDSLTIEATAYRVLKKILPIIDPRHNYYLLTKVKVGPDKVVSQFKLLVSVYNNVLANLLTSARKAIEMPDIANLNKFRQALVMYKEPPKGSKIEAYKFLEMLAKELDRISRIQLKSLASDCKHSVKLLDIVSSIDLNDVEAGSQLGTVIITCPKCGRRHEFMNVLVQKAPLTSAVSREIAKLINYEFEQYRKEILKALEKNTDYLESYFEEAVEILNEAEKVLSQISTEKEKLQQELTQDNVVKAIQDSVEKANQSLAKELEKKIKDVGMPREVEKLPEEVLSYVDKLKNQAEKIKNLISSTDNLLKNLSKQINQLRLKAAALTFASEMDKEWRDYTAVLFQLKSQIYETAQKIINLYQETYNEYLKLLRSIEYKYILKLKRELGDLHKAMDSMRRAYAKWMTGDSGVENLLRRIQKLPAQPRKMYYINIDLQYIKKLTKDYQLRSRYLGKYRTKKFYDEYVKRFHEAFKTAYRELKSYLASKTLTPKQITAYLNGLNISIDPYQGIQVSISGMVAGMLEYGRKGGYLWGFIRESKKKKAEDGTRYVDIPMVKSRPVDMTIKDPWRKLSRELKAFLQKLPEDSAFYSGYTELLASPNQGPNISVKHRKNLPSAYTEGINAPENISAPMRIYSTVSTYRNPKQRVESLLVPVSYVRSGRVKNAVRVNKGTYLVQSSNIYFRRLSEKTAYSSFYMKPVMGVRGLAYFTQKFIEHYQKRIKALFASWIEETPGHSYYTFMRKGRPVRDSDVVRLMLATEIHLVPKEDVLRYQKLLMNIKITQSSPTDPIMDLQNSVLKTLHYTKNLSKEYKKRGKVNKLLSMISNIERQALEEAAGYSEEEVKTRILPYYRRIVEDLVKKEVEVEI